MRAISAVDLHLNRWTHVAKLGYIGSFKSRPLVARVITVEIKTFENASEALDRDPAVIVSHRFITRDHVASSDRSIENLTAEI